MASYRLRTADGVELGIIEATSLLEATTTTAARVAPLFSEIIRKAAAAPRVFARKELWMAEYPAWSLVTE